MSWIRLGRVIAWAMVALTAALSLLGWLLLFVNEASVDAHGWLGGIGAVLVVTPWLLLGIVGRQRRLRQTAAA